jgi:hypothetical protein
MLIIIQIVLTIFAWKKGWKWYSLIPVAVAFGVGFFIGIGVGSAGGSVSDLSGVVVLDILAIVALAIMCFVAPKSKQIEETNEVPPFNKAEPKE